MKELQEVEKELYDVESRRIKNEEYLLDRKNPNLQSKDKPTNYPDAKKHKIVSFIKSIIRIFGYTLIPFNLVWATIILVVSEFIGIIEELV
jgi:hypothetical protein